MNLSTKPAALQISSNFFRKILLQRHLIANLVRRDLRSRYIGSFMGLFWSVIHPFVLLASYTFVFSLVFDIRPMTPATDNFAVFLFCGILPWLYFQESVMRSCSIVLENSNLIKKTLFPSEILPISVALSNLVTHLIGMAILFAVLLAMGLLDWSAFYIVLYFVPLMGMSLGLGWLLSSLNVFLRDTAQVLTVSLVFWFWFTPIFYSIEQVPEGILQDLMRLNPLAAVVVGYRNALLEHRLAEPEFFLILLFWSVLTFVIGGFVFRNTKREFIDVL